MGEWVLIWMIFQSELGTTIIAPPPLRNVRHVKRDRLASDRDRITARRLTAGTITGIPHDLCLLGVGERQTCCSVTVYIKSGTSVHVGAPSPLAGRVPRGVAQQSCDLPDRRIVCDSR